MRRLAAVCALTSLLAQGAAAVASFSQLPTGFGAGAISGDGSVVVGSAPGDFGAAPHRWTSSSPSTTTPIFDPFLAEVSGFAGAVSQDGLIAGGNVQFNQSFDDTTPYRCASLGNCVPTAWEPGFGNHGGSMTGLSSDGSYGAGDSWYDAQDVFAATYWKPSGERIRMTPYDPFDVGEPIIMSRAAGISADGVRAVGWTLVPDAGTVSHAFMWTESGGLQLLGDLPGGTADSRADAISSDGSVIVGSSSSTLGTQAFLWTGSGGMVPLGDLPGGAFSSGASATSSNGSIVVGSSMTAAGFTAFIWDPVNGMRSLQDVLISLGADLTGWHLSGVTDISDDGKTLIGTGIVGGQSRSWYAVIPEPGTALLTALGFAALGSLRRRAVAQR